MSSNFLPSTKVIVSTAASVAATTMLIRSFAKDFIPGELRHYLYTKLRQFLTTFSDEITFMIDEFDGLNKNQLFYAAELYVATIISPSTKTLRASLPKKEKKIHVSLGKHEEIKDNFCGIQLKWRTVTMSKQTQSHFFPYRHTHHSTMMSEVRYLELTFHKKHKNKIVDEYLPYVLAKSEGIKQERKTLKLHSLQNGGRGHWQSVNLDHPANFNTLAMDDEIKNLIIDDLERFLKRKEFYRKIGKAWKRGYLLFGPPGTGKSSLIAAMANYLHFDVYDLELTDLRCNSDWRRLLISTANRSILVVEDIDVSIDLSDRSQEAKKPPPFQHNQGAKVTLSGLLNFMDGLWSSCGDERIIIFTTNHKDKLDPALLRPGRMDMHIHMSYCTPSAFKMLASNYLGTTEHPLVLKAEELIASSKVTPAEVAEQLLKGDDHEVALQGLIKFLEHKTEAGRDGDGNREEMEKVMPNRKLNASNSIDRLKELIKLAKPSLADMSENIPEGDEAANALKILIEFLQGEIGTGNTKDCDEVFAASEAAVLESGKENGIKSE